MSIFIQGSTAEEDPTSRTVDRREIIGVGVKSDLVNNRPMPFQHHEGSVDHPTNATWEDRRKKKIK